MSFYKITSKLNTDNKFVWLDNFNEEVKVSINFHLMADFPDGFESIKIADKNDQDFIDYVKYDLHKIAKEINKLELLRSRLIEQF